MTNSGSRVIDFSVASHFSSISRKTLFLVSVALPTAILAAEAAAQTGADEAKPQVQQVNVAEAKPANADASSRSADSGSAPKTPAKEARVPLAAMKTPSTVDPLPAPAAKPPIALREARTNTKAVMWANAINFGTSFLNAGAEHYGARQCLNEGDLRSRSQLRGRAQHSLMISMPVDSAIAFVSWKLRHRHPGLSVWLPATSAGMQTGFALIQYTQGCF
jgi:hypothetical protein